MVPAAQLALWRWAIAFLPMLALAGATLWAKRDAVCAEWRDLVVLGALGMWICGAFVYIGAKTTSATNIALIYAGSPVLMLLISAAFYRERLSGPQVVGAAIALAGVLAIIVKGDLGALARVEFTAGDLWIVVASISWAVYSVLLRHRPTRLDPVPRLAAITLAGIGVLVPFSLVEAVVIGVPTPDARSVAAVLTLGLLPGFGAYQAYSWLVREIGTARAGLVLYLIPIYSALLAWLLLGEGLAWYHALGAALVLGGLGLANRAPRAS